MNDVLKIVIIGPESTGKSTLCKLLAEHYHTLWCPEYARTYLEKHGTDYTYDALLEIAKRQLDSEEAATNDALNLWMNKHEKKSKKPLLFIDTDMYVMKVWCEYVFNKCHSFILDEISKETRSLYLLCNVDLPWEWDELREYPDIAAREELYHIYKDLMVNQPVPWIDIKGPYNERLKTAVDAVNKLLATL